MLIIRLNAALLFVFSSMLKYFVTIGTPNFPVFLIRCSLCSNTNSKSPVVLGLISILVLHKVESNKSFTKMENGVYPYRFSVSKSPSLKTLVFKFKLWTACSNNIEDRSNSTSFDKLLSCERGACSPSTCFTLLE